LLSSGNFGIGTATPADLLHVNGNARANQFNTVNGIFNTTAAATNMSFNTNGTNRMTLLSGGNFGIGTATPADLLHVNGNARATQFSSTNGTFNTIGATNLSLGTNGTTKMTLLNSNGFLGVNTATPAYQLDVNGTVNATGFLLNGAAFTGSQWTAATGGINYAGGSVGIGIASPFAKLHVKGTLPEKGLYVETNNSWIAYSDGNNYFRGNTFLADTNGADEKVGIGTNTPSQKLEVAGALYVNGNAGSSLTSAEGVIFRNSAASNSTGQWKLGIGTPGNYDNYFVGHMPNNSRWLLVFPSGEAVFPAGAKIAEDMIFSPAQHNNSFLRFNSTDKSVDLQAWQTALKFNVNSLEVARITPTGLGIGKTNPAYALDVAGTINASNILVNGQPFPGGGSSQWSANGNDISYSAGNVGIGTPSLSARLHMRGTGVGTGTMARFEDNAGVARMTLTDNGQLDVTSSAMKVIRAMNSSGEEVFVVNRNDGFLQLGNSLNTSGASVGIKPAEFIGEGPNLNGRALHFIAATSIPSGNGSFVFNPANTDGTTFGDKIFIHVPTNHTTGAASGTSNFTVFANRWTIASSGTHAGAFIGYDYQPTIISLAASDKHLAWRNTSGSMLIGHTMLGASTTRMQVRGIGSGTGLTARFEDSAGNARWEWQDNGALLLAGNSGIIGQVLTSNGGATAPTWMTLPSTQWASGAGNISYSDGNVGIGTTAPDAKLTVKGNIHTNEVKVDLLGAVAPDYVFEPTYDLKPLTEIETYIKENKHLPEVPSAKEMEKNGVQLGEMNMLLLKKVEELTLYSIEQNKKLNEQQELIQELIKEMKQLKTDTKKTKN
jgi:hypothetical protein